MYTIVTGDNSLILQTLKVGANVFDATGLTVKARLVGKNCGTALTDEITCNSGTAGADWANGVIAIVIPGTATEDISCHQHPEVLLETQVDDGTYHKTWFSTLALAKGTIG